LVAVPSALDNGIRSPRKLLAAVVRKLVAALRQPGVLKDLHPSTRWVPSP
jgi:hypothetical protein